MSSDAGVIQLADAGADWSAREKRRPVIQAAARRTLRRRRAAGKAVQTLCVLCAAIALAPLVALVYYTAERGLSGLSFGFLIHAPVPEGVPGGGISTAITGTGEIVGLALVMAIPVGLMTALFLHERRGHLASFIRFSGRTCSRECLPSSSASSPTPCWCVLSITSRTWPPPSPWRC
jgi:ABC-type Fe3+ transport system permease subunit